MMIRLSGYILESIVDGPGIRSVLFTQGCPHKCPYCHNPQTHDFNGGKLCEISEMVKILSSNPLTKGVTISGGEPFSQSQEVLEFIKQYKLLNPNKDIVIYTGYRFEDLVNRHDVVIDEILSKGDILIDGPFINDLKSLELAFRGSRNQRIIDLKHSTIDHIVILDFDEEL